MAADLLEPAVDVEAADKTYPSQPRINQRPLNPRSSTATNTAVDHLRSRAAQMLPTADAEHH